MKRRFYITSILSLLARRNIISICLSSESSRGFVSCWYCIMLYLVMYFFRKHDRVLRRPNMRKLYPVNDFICWRWNYSFCCLFVVILHYTGFRIWVTMSVIHTLIGVRISFNISPKGIETDLYFANPPTLSEQCILLRYLSLWTFGKIINGF